ncbi:MAG: helix-turn-helix domain-containing protein [Nanoarchaeota archaeon]
MKDIALTEFGFSENESKIYLALLTHGMLNPTKIAEKTCLHRSYVYDTLERMLEKGLVSEVYIEKKRHFQAVDPAMIREGFREKARHFDEVLPKLKGLYTMRGKSALVEFHRGERVYNTVIREAIASAGKHQIIRLFGLDESIISAAEPIYLKQYLNMLEELKIQERAIIPKGAKREQHKSIAYCELDQSLFGEMMYVVMSDVVFFFVFDSPFSLVRISSPKVAEGMRKQFDFFWEYGSGTR